MFAASWFCVVRSMCTPSGSFAGVAIAPLSVWTKINIPINYDEENSGKKLTPPTRYLCPLGQSETSSHTNSFNDLFT